MRRAVPTSALAAGLAGLLILVGCAAGPKDQTPAGQPPPSKAASANDDRSAAQAALLLDEATRTLREMRKNTPDRILDAAIAESRALIILPGIYQAGFLYSVHAGNGVLIARRTDGGWGAPVFVDVVGAGYGLQAGLEKSRLVLAVQEEEMVERILAGSFDFDTAAKYDVLGVREETGRGSLTTHRPVLAFGDGVGMMAGVALRGGGLFLNREMTRGYYGADAGSLEEILRSANAPGIEVFRLWGRLGVAPVGPAIVRAGKP
ncbi:MAG: hypothetical protein AUJ49_11380 [Desulfovibrionaceae bacterium CG1_02_65_16]|nr:MAG: hypothetical protein AUJ49_11380 [Desulfovibrionaceae bacterium CG1_02_65_16]